ncbi:MAG: hypothetical protein Q7R80_02525 [bacterium]|nr:hypothetical protein [bacterium]
MNDESGIKDRKIPHNSLFIIHDSARAGWWAAISVLAALFAVGASILSWDNARTHDLAPRFHWPDETSNHFFASRVARGESFSVPEPRNIEAGNLIHPRTVNVRADGSLVPGSYLGLPLWYGLIGRVVGERAMLFLTPLLAALGLLAFAVIVRRFVGASVALLTIILLALHPSLWLFTATSFLPNIPFAALLLTGFAILFSSSRGDAEGSHPWVQRYRVVRFLASLGMTREMMYWLAGGLCIGLALTIRTHELLWVLMLVALVMWRSLMLHRERSNVERSRSPRSFCILHSAFCILGIVIPFIPILLLNAQLYGSPFTTGYALLQDGGASPTEFASSLFPSWFMALVAPFGWHPIEAFTRFWQYMVVPYPWFIGLAVVGLGVTLLSQFRTKLRKDFGAKPLAVVGTMVFTVWLILYYGSWTIADSLVRETNVLTISYVRYWLPITIVLAFWAAVGLRWILDHCVARWRPHIATLVLLGIAITSFRTVVTDPTEGLLRQRAALTEHRTRARAVIAATESNAIIVSHRMDKVFFPERAVVHAAERSQDDPEFLQKLRGIVDRMPVYWYASSSITMPGLGLAPIGTMPFGEWLHRIEAR